MKAPKNISIEPLKKIEVDGGDVLHALKKTDKEYWGFGEVYFSFINSGAIKAWKLHQSMTLNLIVPIGEVRFVFFDPYKKFLEVVIGEKNYRRINVPPGIWFGFKGIHQSRSLIMNVSDMEHDPKEVLRKDINEFKYNW